MNRRFRCVRCGLKWFIPAHKAHLPDLSVCAGCGGRLIAFVGGPGEGGGGSSGEKAPKKP